MKKIKKLFNIFWIQLYLELKLQIRYVNSAISSLVLYAGAFLVVSFSPTLPSWARPMVPNKGFYLPLLAFCFGVLVLPHWVDVVMGWRLMSELVCLKVKLNPSFPCGFYTLFKLWQKTYLFGSIS